jgi:hypothetical protein
VTSRDILPVQSMLDGTETGPSSSHPGRRGAGHQGVGSHRGWVTRRTVRIGLLAALTSLPLATLELTTSASAAPAGGKIQIWSTQNETATSPIIVTGAIGDYGTTTSVDRNGKVDQNGNYEKVVLHQGGFTINSVAFDKMLNKTRPHVSKTNCGATFHGSGPIFVSGGKGAYAGIKGTITAVLNFVAISPTLANGKCNMSQNVNPVAEYGTVTGSGQISF